MSHVIITNYVYNMISTTKLIENSLFIILIVYVKKEEEKRTKRKRKNTNTGGSQTKQKK